MDFFRRVIVEVHRRSLWQVLGIYLVGSWLGYQVILGLYDGLGLPEWVPPLAVILFVIGLPIVLATAFVQEGPPSLPDRTAGRDSDPTLHPGLSAPWPDAGVGTAGGPPAAGPRAGLARLLTWRRSLGAGLAAFILLTLSTTGFMAMRELGIGSVGTLLARGVLDERDGIVLADFAANNVDAGVGAVVTEALRIDLLRTTVVDVAADATVRTALQRMQRDAAAGLPRAVALEVAQREGLKAVIAGEVGALGGGYILTAQVLAAADGAVLAAFRETARDSAQLIDAVDRLSRQMRSRIGESLRDVRIGVPLAQLTTSSLPALRKYAEAERVQRESGDEFRTIRLLEEAIALDSLFAMAWRKLGASLNNLGGTQARQHEAHTRAWELRGRLPEIEALHATAEYARHVLADFDRAIDAYQSMLVLDPDHMAALNNLGLALQERRRLPEAEAVLRRGVERTNLNFSWTNLVAVIYDQGRIDEAKQTYEHARDQYPDNVHMLRREVYFAVGDGRWHAVDSIARARVARFPGNRTAGILALTDRANAALATGRLAEWERLMREQARFFDEQADTARLLAAQLERARTALWVRGEPERAGALLADALRRFPLAALAPEDRPYGALIMLHADLGDHDTATALLAEAVQHPPLRGRGPVDYGAFLSAQLQLRRGDAAAAIEPLQRAASDGMCRICALPVLAQAYEQAGSPDSARAVYERFLTTPYHFRALDERFWRALTLERVAMLHEEAGAYAQAAERYAGFVQLWRDADPELQPRVAAALARIARLTGDR
jgi:eukaryotic-like serine/threonine-protein kinase